MSSMPGGYRRATWSPELSFNLSTMKAATRSALLWSVMQLIDLKEWPWEGGGREGVEVEEGEEEKG